MQDDQRRSGLGSRDDRTARIPWRILNRHLRPRGYSRLINARVCQFSGMAALRLNRRWGIMEA